MLTCEHNTDMKVNEM